MMARTPASTALVAKRRNEKRKLRATTLNAVAIAVFGAALVIPATRPEGVITVVAWSTAGWLICAIALHLLAIQVLDGLEEES